MSQKQPNPPPTGSPPPPPPKRCDYDRYEYLHRLIFKWRGSLADLREHLKDMGL